MWRDVLVLARLAGSHALEIVLLATTDGHQVRVGVTRPPGVGRGRSSGQRALRPRGASIARLRGSVAFLSHHSRILQARAVQTTLADSICDGLVHIDHESAEPDDAQSSVDATSQIPNALARSRQPLVIVTPDTEHVTPTRPSERDEAR
jgi:hypothetical protein